MVGTITTSAVNASDGDGSHASRGARQIGCVAVELGARGGDQPRVGKDLAERARAVAVEVDRHARHLRGQVVGERSPERSLGQVVEVPGLLKDAAVRELEVERDGARGILRGARAGVEDDVVLGERRRARDDALHPLVVRVPLDPEILQLADERADLVALAAPEPLVVEPLSLGELEVASPCGLEAARETGQESSVLEQVQLDAAEVRALRGSRRRSGRRCGGSGRIVVTSAAREEHDHGREQNKGDPYTHCKGHLTSWNRAAWGE